MNLKCLSRNDKPEFMWKKIEPTGSDYQLWLWPYTIVLCVAIVTYDVLLQTPVIQALGVVLQDEELYPEPTKYDSR